MIRISTVPFYETPAVGDLEAREILSSLVDVADEDTHMLSILEYLGQVKPTVNKQFFNYTNTFLYDTITVSGTPTVAEAGTTVTFDDTTKIRKGSVLMANDRRLMYVVSITNATDAVVKTYAGSGTKALTNGQVLAIPTNGTGEGSSNGDMNERPIVKRSNQTQIFENGIQVTDLLLAGRTELTLQDGSQYYYYKIQDDAFRKHRIDIANNHLVGQFGSTTDEDGNTVFFSRGLDNYIVDLGGVSLQSAAVGTVTKADFATYNRALDLARSPKDGMFLVGGDLNVFIDDLFDTELSAGSVDRGKFGEGSDQAKMVDMGIGAFKVYGRRFEKMVLPQLDHVNVTAITGFEYPDLGYFIPKGQIAGEGGQMVDRICGRYLEFASDEYINGRFHEKVFGGLAPNTTSAENILAVRYTSHESIEINGPEHFGRFKVQR